MTATPKAPAIICPECKGLNCTRHNRHARLNEARGNAAANGYDWTWRKARNAHLAAEPLCRHCEREGRVTPATMVDHIVPLPHGPRLDPANLQSLCGAHHKIKTDKDRAAGLTR